MNDNTRDPGESDDLWFMNSWVTVRRPAWAGPDGVSIMEHRMPCGESPPVHVHQREDEVFHILEGSVRFRVSDREIIVGAGETLVAPKRVPHSFRVESASGARFLTILTGCDFETLVRTAGRRATAHALPHPIEPTAQMIEKLTQAAARNRIDILGPPLG
jgi:mannose-6-phosphate isomerase-like protein (cupin superfamily)